MQTLFATSVLALSLAACTLRPTTITAPESAAPQPGSMVVTGSATLEVSPDCADLTITIIAEQPKPGIAARALETKRKLLVAGLAAAGASGADVKLSNLQLDPTYQRTVDGYPTAKVTGYRASLTVTATTRDFTTIAALVDAAASADASTMATAFRRSDLPELKKQVRDLALRAAQAKAKQTATTLGIQIGRITSVAESQGGQMWNQTYFPQVANVAVSQPAQGELGGTMQPLTLDVTINFELPKA